MALKYEAKSFEEGNISSSKPGEGYQTTLNAYTKEGSGNLGYTGIVGIDVTKIPAMKEGIDNYIRFVDTSVESVLNEISYDEAFSNDEMITEIKSFSDAVKTATMHYFSHLRAFQDLLTSIQANYEKQNSEMASNLKTEASSTSSVVDEYKSSAS